MGDGSHKKFLRIIKEEYTGRTIQNPFRVLDVGCGDGKLVLALQSALELEYPDVKIEVYGLEVMEHAGDRQNYSQSLYQQLAKQRPDINWDERIFFGSEGKPWPINNKYFHCVVSKEVIEHVFHHQRFFEEHARVLTEHGIGVHTFPPKENWKDAHLNLYFVHRIKDYDFVKSYIRFCNRIGLGNFKAYQRGIAGYKGISLEEYSDYMADYVLYSLNYISIGEALDYARANRLKPSLIINFRSGTGFLSSIIKKLLLCVLARVGSVTLLVRNERRARWVKPLE